MSELICVEMIKWLFATW